MGASDNFRSVKKLLRLKRYEQPPPRYFREFSSRVIARIEAGEACPAWWERFGFDLRGVMTAGAGAVACAVVIGVLGFALDPEGEALASAPNIPPAFASEPTVPGESPERPMHAGGSSTAPVLAGPDSGLVNPWRVQVQVTPVSYQR